MRTATNMAATITTNGTAKANTTAFIPKLDSPTTLTASPACNGASHFNVIT